MRLKNKKILFLPLCLLLTHNYAVTGNVEAALELASLLKPHAFTDQDRRKAEEIARQEAERIARDEKLARDAAKQARDAEELAQKERDRRNREEAERNAEEAKKLAEETARLAREEEQRAAEQKAREEEQRLAQEATQTAKAKTPPPPPPLPKGNVLPPPTPPTGGKVPPPPPAKTPSNPSETSGPAPKFNASGLDETRKEKAKKEVDPRKTEYLDLKSIARNGKQEERFRELQELLFPASPKSKAKESGSAGPKAKESGSAGPKAKKALAELLAERRKKLEGNLDDDEPAPKEKPTGKYPPKRQDADNDNW